MTEELELLWRLCELDSPSGDEGAFCDFLESHVPRLNDQIKVLRIGDSLIAWRGQPRVALFSHIDTTGFTLGYDRSLIPLGSPAAATGDPLRQAGRSGDGHVADETGRKSIKLRGSKQAEPGTRWVYDVPMALSDDGVISGPYLDNRAGVWAAIRTLAMSENVAVAFTTEEETSGRGALLCGQFVFDELKIIQALISDITWHTKHVKCGEGVAISLRDRYAPRQRYLDKVLARAAESGIPFQREIESEGGSDGSYIQRSSIPMDWVFVGAPEEDAHSSEEKLHVSDLLGMADMLSYLVKCL